MNAAEDIDRIFVNGNIYTANERKPRGRGQTSGIVFVG